MEGGFVQENSHGIMDEEERDDDDVGSLLDFSNDDDEGSCNSLDSSSSSSEFMEDATSSSGSSSSNGPLFEMTSLISQLPFKRGLSKHFEGKSQSFTSLSNVKSLEDLIKPERSFKKKLLKSSKSYGWGLDKSLSPKSCITKKSSKFSPFSSLNSNNNNMKRHSFLAPQRSSGSSNLLLAEGARRQWAN